MPVFCLFTLGRHGNFTAGVTMERPDLLCTAKYRVVEYYRVCRFIDVILEQLIVIKMSFFSVFGRQADKSGQLMVTLNFSSILTKKCEDNDYTTWTPVNKVGSKNIG